MAEAPKVQRIGESWWAIWLGEQVTMEFAYCRDHADGITAEATFTSAATGEHYWARLNLASSQARSTYAKAVTDSVAGGPWRAHVDRACHEVMKSARQGVPAVELAASRADGVRWFMPGWIPAHQVTMVCGDGGSGKSLFALLLAVAGRRELPVAGRWPVAPLGAVLYLDWESDQADHESRLWGLCSMTGDGEPVRAIYYRHMERPLTEELAAVRREVDTLKVDLVIADSCGPAAGPEPESADSAIRLMAALRQIERTVIVLAHIPKALAESRGPARPYGSVYYWNLARSVLEARRDEGEAEDAMRVTYAHAKCNFGPKLPARAIEYAFGSEGFIAVTPADADASRQSLPKQIRDALLGGNKSVDLLAEEMGKSQAQIRDALNAMEKRRQVIRVSVDSPGRGHKTLWGLIDEKRRPET